MTIINFPINPTHGTIFEVENGILYEYDATIKAWIKIASGSILLPLATNAADGAMAAIDLQKLNRLVIPPPTSSIIGNDCVAPFQRGTIVLSSADEFVNVESNVSIQNIDDTGNHIETSVPFQIHQHTYGFDLNLDMNALITELINRGQFDITGPTGVRGNKGAKGDPGEDYVLSGPQGAKGAQGTAPECALDVQTEILQASVRPGLKRALTGVTIVPDSVDPTKYGLIFDRQVVGKTDASTSYFKVKQQKSSWVLAVTSIAGAPQPVYYLDIDPIVEAIHIQFLEEVQRLKSGYEDIVKFWVQTMSDLFDEQKTALCCALEFCISKTKSEHLRRHMEVVAATALPDARIEVNTRTEAYDNSLAELVSGTSLLPRIGQPDLCANSLQAADAESASAQSATDHIVVDPILHVTSANANTITLPPGNYIATLASFDAQINGKHFADLALSCADGGSTKNIRFLNKGTYSSLLDAKAAYEGLSVAFHHDGGEVGAYLHMLPTANASGNITVVIKPEEVREVAEVRAVSDVVDVPVVSQPELDNLSCLMSVEQLQLYEQSWRNGQCCGLIFELDGQQYIVVKRSIGDDLCCGGGADPAMPCIAKFSHIGEPAFAWPTVDGENFAPLPANPQVFTYNEELNILAITKIANGEFTKPKGHPPGIRHLSFQLDFILFPTA